MWGSTRAYKLAAPESPTSCAAVVMPEARCSQGSCPSFSSSDEVPYQAVCCGCAGANRYGILALTLCFLAFLMSRLVAVSCFPRDAAPTKWFLSLIAFNANFVAMMDKTTSPLNNGSSSNETDWASSDLSIGDRRLSFGVTEKSLSFAGSSFLIHSAHAATSLTTIISGGFAGSMLATFPMNILLQKYGPHKVMTVVGILCTLTVAVTPLVVCWSFPAFVVLRVISVSYLDVSLCLEYASSTAQSVFHMRF